MMETSRGMIVEDRNEVERGGKGDRIWEREGGI